MDAMIVGVTLMEFHLMYAALVAAMPLSRRRQALRRLLPPTAHVQLHPHGGVAPGSRLDEVRRRFNGSFPDFPLGDPSKPSDAQILSP